MTTGHPTRTLHLSLNAHPQICRTCEAQAQLERRPPNSVGRHTHVTDKPPEFTHAHMDPTLRTRHSPQQRPMDTSPHSTKCTKTSIRNAIHHETDHKKQAKAPHPTQSEVQSRAGRHPCPKMQTRPAQRRHSSSLRWARTSKYTSSHKGCADTFSQCDPF